MIMRDVLFFVVLGVILAILGGALTPAYAPRTMGGPALIILYAAFGFLTVGAFGLLSSLLGFLTRDAGMRDGWRYAAGALGAAGVLFIAHLFL
jgi:hypothetical protein